MRRVTSVANPRSPVASHLGIRLREYDARIRTFVPAYEEMLEAAAGAVADTAVRRPRVLDLGTGTGALASRVLRAVPDAYIVGIDSDPGMLAVAARRLGARLTPVAGNFERPGRAGVWPAPAAGLARVGPFDAITASLALHHVRTRRRKAALYRRCFAALRPGGVLVNADNALSASPGLRRQDRAWWRGHLQRTYGRARAERFLRAWAHEDVYFALDEEIAMLRGAGFAVDVPWRRRSFAVVVGIKKARSRHG
jgi:tRNA (cmo5U34)-methyltransferase